MRQEPLNIVVLVCHDLGQRLGCYGVPGIRSPNVDAFAASGVRFASSFCTAPQCSPSRAALWTGRFPHANGVVGLTHGGFANDLHPDEKHLAQLLRAAGYETHLFGVQHEARETARCGHEHVHPPAECGRVARDAARFVARRRADAPPFFAQIGLTEPHRPFPHAGVTPLPPAAQAVPPYLPDIPEIREDLAEMEASIAAADQAWGEVVAAVRASPVAGRTLLVFTTDHGIPFPRAKMTLYDPGIETALILAGPGLPAGVVRREMISNVDVMPTLLALAGLPCPTNLHGRSFSGLLTDRAYTPNELIFAEKTYHTYYDPMRAVRGKRWKLIVNFECAPWQETSPDYFCNAKGYVETAKALEKLPAYYHPPFELFDLANDPHERRNLADDADHRDILRQMAGALRAWMEKTNDPLLDGPVAQGAYRERMRTFKRIGRQD
jgi:N-sulfoglucosamine sulfohydrolase